MAMPLAKCNKKVLAIPDLHCPFEHPDAIEFLREMKKAHKPDLVVCLGDEIDAHALSDHEHDPDGYSAGHELEKAINCLRPVYELFPEVRVCTSNHTSRIFRRAFSSGMPSRLLRGYREILDAPRTWKWADYWLVDGVRYEHGEGLSGAMAAAKAASGNQCPTVIGHIHAFAGIAYAANAETLYWGMNSGCLIDVKAYSFRYGRHYKSKPIIGASIIDCGIPRFLPMLLNKHGRWIGPVSPKCSDRA